MRDAVTLALDDARQAGLPVALVAPLGAAAVQNPHEDEGSDNDADAAAAPGEIRILAERGVHVVVGPLRLNVARAESQALAIARTVAVSGEARGPSELGTRVFKLSPSDRQLAATAHAWIRKRWGTRICVLDDGTPKARDEAEAFSANDPGARRATLGHSGIDACLQRADALYATALEADPVFCSARTARRAPARALVQALALRSFDPAAFARAGRLWRAEPAPIPNTAAVAAMKARYRKRAFVAATDPALRFYAAVQIAVAAARAGGDPRSILSARPFRTILGTVRFSARGEIRAPRIVVRPAN